MSHDRSPDQAHAVVVAPTAPAIDVGLPKVPPTTSAPNSDRSPLEIAHALIERGWSPIPIPFAQKGPKISDWPNLRITSANVASYFGDDRGNVGVLLGAASNNLVDIDLDCPETVELAPRFLASTGTFGRPSKLKSHWLYLVNGVSSRKFKSPEKVERDGKPKVLVEIRSTGAQTVFPGSTHPSGEVITWHSEAEPIELEPDDLELRVAKLATAALLVRGGWEKEAACLAVDDVETLNQIDGALGTAAREFMGMSTATATTANSRPQATASSEVHSAVEQYNADHPRMLPRSGGSCPSCGHHDCFGQLADNPERWACFSASHGAEHGGLAGDGCWHGDALDLDANAAGCSRVELLRRDGYLESEDAAIISVFMGEIESDAGLAFSKALQSPARLWAIRRRKKDVAAFELMKFELEKSGLKRAQVAALLRAAQSLKRAKPAVVQPAGVATVTPVAAPQFAATGGAPPSVVVPQAAPAPKPRPLPTIEVYDREFRDVEADTVGALLAGNTPPRYFRRGGAVVSVAIRGGVPQLVDYTPHTIIRVLSVVANWLESRPPKPDMDPIPHAVFPDKTVAKSLLGAPPTALPEIENVATTPYLGSNNVIVAAPGYSAANKVYLSLDPALVLPPLSAAPTVAEVTAAVKLLVDDVYGDFPFVHQADRAHQIALTLLPFLRNIDGPTPLHVAGAPEAGTGKGLLCDVVATIATGAAMPWRALPPKEEERVKAIFSALRAGTPFMAFDNAKGEVEGPALESALTSRFFASRVLGSHTEGVAPNRAAWVMTANNAELSRDLVRRSIRIRIDAKSEKPEEGRVFKHPHLLEWVRANRGQIVHAVLTIIQNWVALGCPASNVTRRASFESWSDVVGGILAAAGVAGFLDPAAAMDSADQKRGEAAAFVGAWFKLVGRAPMTAKELLDMVAAPPQSIGGQLVPPKEPTYLSSVLGGANVGSRSSRLGTWCHRNANRIFGANMIVEDKRDEHAGINRYKLVAPPPQPLVSTDTAAAVDGAADSSGGPAGGAQELSAGNVARESQT
ncbi:MAG: bifunctional DNA primase/polymerase [Myxococcaceae bacterium]